MRRFTEAQIPDHLHLQVQYIKDQRWFTSAKLIEDTEDGPVIVASGCSTCSYKDNPVRKIGRAIAVGRALKSYYEREAARCPT